MEGLCIYVGQSVKRAAGNTAVMLVVLMFVSLPDSLVSGPFPDVIGSCRIPVVAVVLFAIGSACPVPRLRPWEPDYMSA